MVFTLDLLHPLPKFYRNFSITLRCLCWLEVSFLLRMATYEWGGEASTFKEEHHFVHDSKEPWYNKINQIHITCLCFFSSLVFSIHIVILRSVLSLFVWVWLFYLLTKTFISLGEKSPATGLHKFDFPCLTVIL